ncbi:MAG TPA: hypothetical protein PLB18_19445 [Acidobacteriota bacterium]|nr:hypothetical protein [Acidobacteriota bacterium]HND21552.1 hypothetical protein [Acidobacteriota bacterium]HNJ43402.1 hypothetical protein [Acidobacteriota bacterium]
MKNEEVSTTAMTKLTSTLSFMSFMSFMSFDLGSINHNERQY